MAETKSKPDPVEAKAKAEVDSDEEGDREEEKEKEKEKPVFLTYDQAYGLTDSLNPTHLRTPWMFPVLVDSKKFYTDFDEGLERHAYARYLYVPTAAESYFVAHWYRIENPDTPLLAPPDEVPFGAYDTMTMEQIAVWWATIMNSPSDALMRIIRKRIALNKALNRFIAAQTINRLPTEAEIYAAQNETK
jgi:hypothetical protein